MMNNNVLSPTQRAWQRFKKHRRGYYSLWIFLVLFILSLCAEWWSNDKPLIIFYENAYYFPILFKYPEITFGGDFATETDYRDPFILARITENAHWAIFPLNPYHHETIDFADDRPVPSPPSAAHWLGTDDRGRDIVARLIYGFRLSVIFGLLLTGVTLILGLIAGAIQGYLGGRVDLYFQRFIEIWSSLPELYLLIIFASLFQPSFLLLLILLSLFSWMGLAEYVRAEFLRGRNMAYVRAAQALGLSNTLIIWRHLMPNTLTPVITFLPFRLSGAILVLTSLDFLGLGIPTSESLGELLAQGKANIGAWWLSLSTFCVLIGMLILLMFMGEGLRDALDTRRGE